MNRSHVLISSLCVAAACLAGCYVETEPAGAPVAEGEVVVADPPPPPPPVAEAPPAPGPPGTVWVAGAHRWDGHAYVWERGHYDRPPRAGSGYVAGHWEQRGNRGKVWVNGHWG
jgi:hypothetical protein